MQNKKKITLREKYGFMKWELKWRRLPVQKFFKSKSGNLK